MTKEEIHGGTQVVNKKYGTREYIVFPNILMKDSQKDWIPAVVYIGPDRFSEDNKLKIFCKNQEDFLKEFELDK